jgi:CDP-diglyceride synthetase
MVRVYAYRYIYSTPSTVNITYSHICPWDLYMYLWNRFTACCVTVDPWQHTGRQKNVESHRRWSTCRHVLTERIVTLHEDGRLWRNAIYEVCMYAYAQLLESVRDPQITVRAILGVVVNHFVKLTICGYLSSSFCESDNTSTWRWCQYSASLTTLGLLWYIQKLQLGGSLNCFYDMWYRFIYWPIPWIITWPKCDIYWIFILILCVWEHSLIGDIYCR